VGLALARLSPPLRLLPEMRLKARAAQSRAAAKIKESGHLFHPESSVDGRRRRARSEIPLRAPQPLAESERVLRDLSEEAAEIFNSQLIIVQPRE
jgi:hypothetical protein